MEGVCSLVPISAVRGQSLCWDLDESLGLLCQGCAQLLAKVRLAICLQSTAVFSLGVVSTMF